MMNIITHHMSRMLKAMQKSILVYVLFASGFLLPGLATSQTASVTVNWSSGWCSMCGGQSYSCIPPWSGSGNWNNGIRNFTNPVPAGCTITNVCVLIAQANCGYSSMCATINGVSIGCGSPPGNCNCGTCWPMTVCRAGALPGYNYSGTNSLQLLPNGLACVSYATITFTYTCCINSVAPSSASATNNPSCGGASTLSVNGGSLGTGASWKWYSGGCPGTLVGTGTSISVSPGSTTTYYVRAEGSCNTTGCAQVTVTVNTPSTAPSSASASPTSVCGGGATTLTVGGGSLGTGASWKWYSGSCGGNAVGTGSSISVSPTSTITYFVRAEGACNTTGCAQVTVTAGSNSIAPSSATANPNPTCGGATLLTQNGGSLGTGASYMWYNGACGGTLIGTGPTLSVSPSSTTTYYVLASGTCNTTVCAPVTVTVSTAPIASATPVSQSICSGSTTSIALNSNLPGTTFTWTVAQTNVSGATIGNGTSIAQTLSTTGTVTGTAIYTITPTKGGCIGNPITVTIVVNPIPNLTAIPSTQIICSGGVTSISLTSSVTPSAFNWTVVQTGTAGAAAGSGSIISQTIVATGTTPGTAVYTVTPSTVNCTGPPVTVTVTVNPLPVALAVPSTQTICSGTATSIALTSNVSGTVFNWTATQTGVSGASAGSGSTIAQTLVTTGTTSGTVTYSVTPSVGTCAGIPILVTLTVNPKPVATATPSSQAFCTGGSTSIALTSNLPGTTFAWTVVQAGGVTGASAGSGTTIVQALSLSGTAPGTAVYTITPTLTGNGCSGTPITVTVTVNPIPTVVATPASQTICSGATTGITLTSNVPGSTTYAWTISQLNVSGGVGGTGSTIAQTLTTTGSTPGTAVYTITPSAFGCVGSPISVTVNVNPRPTATATPTVQTICSGDPTAIALTSNIPGSTFSWTVVQTGGATGASAGSGSAITQVLTTGAAIGTVTYSVTPTSGVCPGTPITVTITVNPKPIVIATPASQAICSGAATSIALTSNIPGTTFSWTINQTGVTGATAGSGSSIAQTLTLSGSTAGTVIYTVTPSTSNGCLGSAITIVITVNKKDNPTFNYSNSTYCKTEPNPTPAITGLAGGLFSATPAGLVFINANSGQINLTASTIGTYAITYLTNGPCPATSTVNVTIITVPVATFTYAPTPFCQYSSNISPVFPSGASAGVFTAAPVGLVFTNPATGVIDLTLSTPGTYTVTNTIAPGPCPGASATFSITINTAPIATATPPVKTICSGGTTSIALTSQIPSTTFAWTVVQTGVTGATAASGTTIAQTLSTSGTVTGTAVYTIIPTSPGGCPGQAITVTITVNPVPSITATPTAQTICSYSLTNIALSSNVVGTFFSWTVVQTGVAGAAAGSGSVIAQTLNATGIVSGTATYTITPKADSCNGTPIIVIITVKPQPVLTVTPATQTVCSGTATSIALTSNIAGTTFAWTFNQTNASGAADGTGSTIAQTLTATGTTPGIVIYSVVPTANGCTGPPILVTVNVNPIPVLTATPPRQAFCSFGSTSITLTSNIPSTTFAWTVVQAGVTGATPGNSSTIVQTLSTSGTTTGTAIYTITPTAGGCSGTPVKDTVTVSPIPLVTAIPVSQTICAGGTTSIALSSNVAGAVLSWTVVQTGVSGATVGSGASIAQTLTTTGITTGTALYTVTPTYQGCVGSPISVSIAVNPKPVITLTPSPVTICSGDTTLIALTSNIPGTTFVWSYSQVGASGASSGNGSTIAQTLSTTGATPGRVIYMVTATYGPCSSTTISDTVTIKPRPLAIATPASQTLCSGQTTSIALTSNVTGTTFPWTVIQTDVSGATAGSGSTIAQTLTNTSFFQLPGTAIYKVTPLVNGCSGTPINVPITVKHSDDGTFSYTSGTYCQSAPNPTPTITGLPGGKFTSSPAGLVIDSLTGYINTALSALGAYNLCYTTNGPCPVSNCMTMTITIAPSAIFSYTGSPFCQYGTNPAPIFATGASAGVFSATPAGLQFVHVNTGVINLQTSAAGTYLVTNTIPAGGTCAAEIKTFTITINPAPTATATPATQTICSGSTTSFVLSSSMPGTTYNWTVTQTNVSGASAGTGTSIVQTLATTSTAPGTVVYIITPTAGGCTGLPITVTVTVNSIPSATAVPSAQIICSGGLTTIVLTSNIPGTTYAWTDTQTGVSGATPGSGSIISQTLTATGTSAGTAIYTITPTAGGCVGTPITATITVNPKPAATATPSAQTLCSGDSTSIALTGNIAGTTFTWTVAQSGATGASAGNGTLIKQILTATFGTTPGTVTYTITPSANGCSGTPTLVTVTVNPNPIVTIAPTSQTICSGSATSLALTSNIPGTTFTWTVTQTGVSGATAGSGSNIVQTLTATGSIAGTAVYHIIPTANGCPGLPQNVTVTVNPTPVVTATPSVQTICSGSATSIALTSNVAGTTFAWTVSQNNVTGATAGSGLTIAQTLTAATAGTALYIVTPTSGGCPGSPISVTITVKPTLVAIALPSTKTICSGNSIAVVLSSNISGTTFAWTVTQTGGASGASAGSGSTITQTLATTSTTGTVVYTITPTSGTCTGAPITVTITVDPLPAAAATLAAQTICAGNTASIALTSNVPGTTFSWTISQTNITGATGGTGPFITQTLTTTGPGPGNVTYTITPLANGCPGTPITATVAVVHLDDAAFTYTSATYCQSGPDQTPTYIATPGGTFVATTPPNSLIVNASTGVINLAGSAIGTYTLKYSTNGPCPNTSTINVTITNNPSAVFSYLGSPFCQFSPNPTPIYGAGASAGIYTASPAGLVFVHVNTGEIDLALSAAGTYTVTNTIPASGLCGLQSATYSVTINPAPIATATPNAQTICSGNATSFVLTSTMPTTTYSWTVVQLGVSGASAGTGTSIVQTLSTTGIISGTAVYTITPIAGGCIGVPITVTVTVNPGPIATAVPSAQIICSGNSTAIALSSNIPGTTFVWTVVQTGVTGATLGSGSTIVQTLTATGASAGTAVYTITPTLNSCPGIPLPVTITVNPSPVVTATPAAQTICSGDTASIALTSNVAGTTFSWTASQLGVSGASNGNGILIKHVLSATGIVAGTVTYVITPTAPGGCPGQPTTATVTVNPKPVVTITPTAQVICSGGTTAIILNSNITGTTFAWTVVQTKVSGATSGSGTSIAQTLTATDSIPGTAVYTVIPTITATGCAGAPVIITVTVNPNPIVKATPTAQTICSGSTTGISLTSNVAGTTFSWTVLQTGVTGAVPGSGATIAQTLFTTGSTFGTSVYTITPTNSGCTGGILTVTIRVNRMDSTAFSYGSNSFCQSGIDPVAIITGLPGGTFYSSTGLVLLDTLTGKIDVSASTLGVHQVKYKTNGVCSDTSIVNVTISAAPTVGFSYSDTSYCQYGSNPSPIFVPGAIAGTFSVTPAGLVFVNGSPGKIDLSASALGSYIIKNKIPPSGGCGADSSMVHVTIVPLIAHAIPSPHGICSGSATNIHLTSSLPGTTFAWTVVATGVSGASPGSDTTIAQILTATGTVPGRVIYSITPTTSACVGNPIKDTVTVYPAPIAHATPSSQTICSDSATSIHLISNRPGTIFSWTVTETGVTGAVAGTDSIIAQTISTTGTVAGTAVYTITPSANGCPGTPIKDTIHINPADNASFVYSSATYCQSGTNPTPTITGLPGGTFSAVPSTGLSINPATGTIILSTSTLGVYTITYKTNGSSCPSSSSITMTIGSSSPSAVFSYPGSPFCKNGNDPLPTFAAGSSAGIFSASPSGLVFVHVNTGQIDLSASTPGTYTVTNYIPASGTCLSATQTALVTITLADNASFTYTSATYCTSGNNPTPSITGLPGGTFSATPAGLVIDSITGIIRLDTSALGSYTLSYSTHGPCPNTSSIIMTITDTTPSAQFNYQGSPFCQNGNDPSPNYSAGASAGIFSATPAGLVFVHVNTGQIDLSASAPGTYTVKNTIPASGSCLAASATTQVTISASDNASFTYSSATYCQTGTNPTPSITGLSGGTFTATPSGLVIDSLTGTISLSGSALGAYTLFYSTHGSCPNTSSIIMTIGNTTPIATFTYPSATYCQSGTNPSPVYVPGASAGIFSASPAGLVFVNLNTGEINLTASAPGTYTVTNTIPASGTCIAASATTTVIITMLDNVTFSYTSATYCKLGTNPTPTIIPSGSVGTFSSTPVGLALNPTTGTINLTASALGVYNLCYATSGSCPHTICITMTIIDSATTPVATFSYQGTPFCQGGNNPFPTFGTGSSAGTFTAAPPGLVFVHVNTGQINLTGSAPGIYTVTNTIPVSGGCAGALATTLVTIGAAPVITATPTTQTICTGAATSIALTSSLAGTSFHWTVNQTGVSGGAADSLATIAQTLTVTGANQGTATYTITPIKNGCPGNPISVPVTVSPLPSATTISVIITPANCFDTAGSISGLVIPPGQNSFTYVWKDSAGVVVGGDSVHLGNVKPGKYSLTITDPNGCSTIIGPYTVGSSSIVIAAFTPNPTTGQTPLTVNFTNQSLYATHYLWNFGPSDTSTQTDPVYIVVPPGLFTVCLTAYNVSNCIDTACAIINVDQNSMFIVPNVFTPNGDNVNDVFTIQGVSLKTLNAEIFNRWGEKVYEWNSTHGGWDGRTASGLLSPTGTYYYVIHATGIDGKVYFEKGSFSLIREN